MTISKEVGRLWNHEVVAAYIGVSLVYAQELMQNNILPSFPLPGAKMLFTTQEDCEEFIAQFREKAKKRLDDNDKLDEKAKLAISKIKQKQGKAA